MRGRNEIEGVGLSFKKGNVINGKVYGDRRVAVTRGYFQRESGEKSVM